MLPFPKAIPPNAAKPAAMDPRCSQQLRDVLPASKRIRYDYDRQLKPIIERAEKMTGTRKQESGPGAIKVPFGCKVLGWVYIVDALSLMFENGDEPTGILNIFKTAVCFTVITSATAMLLGRKMGLAAFSMLLVMGGISIFLFYFYSAGQEKIPFKAVAVPLLYYFIPTAYLLSKWNVFSLIDAPEPAQNTGSNAFSKNGTLIIRPARRIDDGTAPDKFIQLVKEVFAAITTLIKRR